MGRQTLINLAQFKRSVYSTHGQDGVIQKIFDTIGTTNKYFVEFGSSGEKSGGGNTPNLRKDDFVGLLMNPSINVSSEFVVHLHTVTPENINELFEKYQVSYNFDFLSIDIDGQDFHVWNALSSQYKPRVVCIESNYQLPPDKDCVCPKDNSFRWGGGVFYGSSATALMNLGIHKGYSLVAIAGPDCIFVLNEYAKHFDHINDPVFLSHGEILGPVVCPDDNKPSTEFIK